MRPKAGLVVAKWHPIPPKGTKEFQKRVCLGKEGKMTP
jgi:hypothetical protein